MDFLPALLLAGLAVLAVAHQIVRLSAGSRALGQEVEVRARRLERKGRELLEVEEEREEARRELVRLETRDLVTGLPNRADLLRQVRRALLRAQHQGHGGVALLVVDIDRFRAVVAGVGHVGADRILAMLSSRLHEALRPRDLLARIGSDELAAALFELENEAVAHRVAERLIATFEDPIELDGQEIFLTARIGLAYSRDGGSTAEALLRDASIAKSHGKADQHRRVVAFDSAAHRSTVELVAMEASLRHALDRGEFALAFQPIVSLLDGRVLGFESLLRWHRRGHAPVPPGEFLALVEESGLIVPITRWILTQAARQAVAWRRAGSETPPYVSVNLSGVHIAEGTVVDDVRAALPPAPSALRVEITESVALENVELVARTLTGLRELGVKTLLDDFGTGYSSLSYLHHFQFDVLKIDRSFVGRVQSPEGRTLLRTIAVLARELGMSTVAEGVETETQRSALAEIGCDAAQGYLFGAPMTADEALLLLD